MSTSPKIAIQCYKDFRAKYSEKSGFRCTEDAIMTPIADWAIRFCDKSPLSELTDEQYKAAGMTRHDDKWRRQVGPKVYIVKWDAFGCVHLYNYGTVSKLHNVTTVGQLLHLIAAMEGT